jgi:hypothetical protein
MPPIVARLRSAETCSSGGELHACAICVSDDDHCARPWLSRSRADSACRFSPSRALASPSRSKSSSEYSSGTPCCFQESIELVSRRDLQQLAELVGGDPVGPVRVDSQRLQRDSRQIPTLFCELRNGGVREIQPDPHGFKTKDPRQPSGRERDASEACRRLPP